MEYAWFTPSKMIKLRIVCDSEFVWRFSDTNGVGQTWEVTAVVDVTPPKTNCLPKMMGLGKGDSILNMAILGIYVEFLGVSLEIGWKK